MKNTNLQWILVAALALTPTAVLAQETAQPAKPEAPKVSVEAIKSEDGDKPAQDAQSKDDAQQKTEDGSTLTSVPGGKALGMSILGNQEAPKALVIVPWKTSELGNGPSVSTLLDDSRSPVDKEVFMRMLSYYGISSKTAHPSGEPTNGNATAPAPAAQRRK
jgi:hypothetical protein